MFENEIKKLNNNLDAIKGFINLVDPVLEERREENFKRDKDDLELLEIMLSSFIDDEETKISDEAKKRIEENFEGKFSIEKYDKGFKLSVSGKGGERFGKAMQRIREISEQKRLLYKSCLMNIISASECFLADLLKTYFKEYPQAMKMTLIKGDDKFFSYDNLTSFSTMDDARDYLIDIKIENLIRNSFLYWIDFLKQKMGLKMGYMKEVQSVIYEVFLRRNLFVHNNGIINSVYLSNVDKSLVNSNKKIGKAITLNKKYLLKQIDNFERLFILISLELWKNSKSYDETRYPFITNQIIRNMDLNRWELVLSFTKFLLNEGNCPLDLKNMAKINYWLAHKKMGTFEKIKIDVEKEDFSACTKDFLLCKCALLGQKEEVIKLLEVILKTGQATVEELQTWPVLDDYRVDEVYNEIINQYIEKEVI